MPPNSFHYLLFLAVVAIVNSFVRQPAGWPWSQAWLLAASLFYFVYTKPTSVPLLVGSIVFNWAIARIMMGQTDDRRRKALLWFGLTANIFILFIFKYIDTLLDAAAFFYGHHVASLHPGLPLGVSFYTLTQIMYLVDAFPRSPKSEAAARIYKGLLKPNSLFDHATFVALFCYAVSGPLVKARSIVPQFRRWTMPEEPLPMACRGIFLFSIGLAKKVVIADSFAPIADAGFKSVRNYSMMEAWVFCLAALLHLYFDFSGYSDMAVGAAWMLGVDIPQNFNAPLRATTISDFWKRWHISLSNFITEYLYTPLLRAMPSPTMAASALATMLALVVAAAWHGPALTFIAWGFSHGVALVVNQVWNRQPKKMPDWMGWLVTAIFITSTIVFLRATSMTEALRMLTRLAPHSGALQVAALRNLMPISPSIVLHPFVYGAIAAYFFKSSMEYSKEFHPSFKTALATATLILMSLVFMNSAQARVFVYFGF